MKIREEDFDVNEGLDRYKNDKKIEEHEKMLKNNKDLLYKLLSEKLEDFSTKVKSIDKVVEVVLKGEYEQNKLHPNDFFLECYPEGYVEIEANNEMISIRWDNDWFSVSY